MNCKTAYGGYLHWKEN